MQLERSQSCSDTGPHIFLICSTVDGLKCDWNKTDTEAEHSQKKACQHQIKLGTAQIFKEEDGYQCCMLLLETELQFGEEKITAAEGLVQQLRKIYS